MKTIEGLKRFLEKKKLEVSLSIWKRKFVRIDTDDSDLMELVDCLIEEYLQQPE